MNEIVAQQDKPKKNEKQHIWHLVAENSSLTKTLNGKTVMEADFDESGRLKHKATYSLMVASSNPNKHV